MFKRFFTRFLRRHKPTIQFPAPMPAQTLAVIGDVHGRADLLRRALEQGRDAQIILVGDYTDRGEQSAEVLRLLHARSDLICLIGNHEDMLLRFLDDPTRNGKRWLRYGGRQTLASFGIVGVSETTAPEQLEDIRDELAKAMGPDLTEWLRALPSSWQSGNVVICHAGADPTMSIAGQEKQVLHWGHRDFESTLRMDGLWIVHGHTIVDAPVMKNGRINVDTGAYATGRLTTARISDQGVSFTTVRQHFVCET